MGRNSCYFDFRIEQKGFSYEFRLYGLCVNGKAEPWWNARMKWLWSTPTKAKRFEKNTWKPTRWVRALHTDVLFVDFQRNFFLLRLSMCPYRTRAPLVFSCRSWRWRATKETYLQRNSIPKETTWHRPVTTEKSVCIRTCLVQYSFDALRSLCFSYMERVRRMWKLGCIGRSFGSCFGHEILHGRITDIH